MSRHDREAKLEALYGGGPDGMVLVTEHGGRKRDARKTLQDRMSKMMATIPNPASDVHQPSDAPMMGSYQEGSLPNVLSSMGSVTNQLLKSPDFSGSYKDAREAALAYIESVRSGRVKAPRARLPRTEEEEAEHIKELQELQGRDLFPERSSIWRTRGPNMNPFSGSRSGERKYQAGTLPSYQKGTLGEVAKRMASERGLEYAEGRRPGSMFMKGPGGEKLALQHGDEFLDLISVGGGKGDKARELFELLDELGSEGGAQVRRGTSNLSEAGQRSIENAVSKGHLVRNPAGAGWLSTAQKMGKKAAAAAKGAAGGVTALLDPLFGAIQDPGLAEDLDPEMRGTLESVLGTFGGGGKGPIG